MTQKMTEDLKEKKIDKNLLQKENQTLQNQLLMMQDLKSLQDQAFYRQQKLMILERQTQAQERQAKAMEDLARGSEETPLEESNEEE